MSDTSRAIVQVHRPTLTAEELAQRMAIIKQAAANLAKASILNKEARA